MRPLCSVRAWARLAAAAALALVVVPQLAACKNGCEAYIDEVVAKSKECGVDSVGAPPKNLSCTQADSTANQCLAACVKALSCEAFVCVVEEASTCSDVSSFAAYGTCASKCAEESLCANGACNEGGASG
jgi:hypothetical protein